MFFNINYELTFEKVSVPAYVAHSPAPGYRCHRQPPLPGNSAHSIETQTLGLLQEEKTVNNMRLFL